MSGDFKAEKGIDLDVTLLKVDDGNKESKKKIGSGSMSLDIATQKDLLEGKEYNNEVIFSGVEECPEENEIVTLLVSCRHETISSEIADIKEIFNRPNKISNINCHCIIRNLLCESTMPTDMEYKIVVQPLSKSELIAGKFEDMDTELINKIKNEVNTGVNETIDGASSSKNIVKLREKIFFTKNIQETQLTSNCIWNEEFNLNLSTLSTVEESYIRFDLTNTFSEYLSGFTLPIQDLLRRNHYTLKCELPGRYKSQLFLSIITTGLSEQNLNSRALLGDTRSVDNNTIKNDYSDNNNIKFESIGVALESFQKPTVFPVSPSIAAIHIMQPEKAIRYKEYIQKLHSTSDHFNEIQLPTIQCKLRKNVDSLNDETSSTHLDLSSLLKDNKFSEETSLFSLKNGAVTMVSSPVVDAFLPSWRYPVAFEVGTDFSKTISASYPESSDFFTIVVDFFTSNNETISNIKQSSLSKLSNSGTSDGMESLSSFKEEVSWVYYGSSFVDRPLNLFKNTETVHISEIPVEFTPRSCFPNNTITTDFPSDTNEVEQVLLTPVVSMLLSCWDDGRSQEDCTTTSSSTVPSNTPPNIKKLKTISINTANDFRNSARSIMSSSSPTSSSTGHNNNKDIISCNNNSNSNSDICSTEGRSSADVCMNDGGVTEAVTHSNTPSRPHPPPLNLSNNQKVVVDSDNNIIILNSSRKVVTEGADTPDDDASGGELTHRLKFLKHELNNKQDIIDRLNEEIDRRASAIRTCGIEIVSLRKQMKQKEDINKELSNRLKEREEQDIQITNELTDTSFFDFKSLTSSPQFTTEDFNEVLSRLRRVGKKYMIERQRNIEILEQLKSAAFTSQQLKLSENKIIGLEKSLRSQQRHIQTIQRKNSKVHAYKSTILTQEKLIGKLELLIEKKIRDNKRHSALNDNNIDILGSDAVPMNLTVNNDSHSRSSRINSITTPPNSDPTPATPHTSTSPGSSGDALKIKQLMEEIQLLKTIHHKEIREKDEVIQIIESQMKKDSKTHGAELAALKTKILEAEVLAMGGFGSPAGILNEVPARTGRKTQVPPTPDITI